MLVFVFKYDSPVYYLKKNDKQNYYAIMSKIYKTCILDDEEDNQSNGEQTVSKDISWSELFSANFRYALIIGVALSAAQQGTGCTFVTFYSNEIFMQGLSGSEAERAARIGSFFLGVVSSFGVICAIYFLKVYGRKILMLTGVVCIGITHIMLFIASMTQNTGMIKIAVLIFVFIFNSTIGGILWIYASEILSTKGISLVAQMNNVCGLFFGSMVNIFFNLLTPSGVYFCFVVIQLLSCGFIFMYIKETKGLSKAECESLYSEKVNDKYIELPNKKFKDLE